MDTSETYIKMCEKAREIQELAPNPKNEREEDKGSLFWDKTDTYLSWLVEDNDTGWWMIGGYGDEEHTFTWLPRQDQLQEMVSLCSGKIISEFHLWYFALLEISTLSENDRLYFKCSMEQLWMAFVMSEKYNKVWNGEDWITGRS